jgi:hypothetical protein
VPVGNTADFKKGCLVTIAKGTPQEESNEITGYGSVLLKYPLKFPHKAGTTVVQGAQVNGVLTAFVKKGDNELPVANTADFKKGYLVTIAKGTSLEESNEITGYGSLLLKYALKFAHQAGTPVVQGPLAPPPAVAKKSAANTTSPPTVPVATTVPFTTTSIASWDSSASSGASASSASLACGSLWKRGSSQSSGSDSFGSGKSSGSNASGSSGCFFAIWQWLALAALLFGLLGLAVVALNAKKTKPTRKKRAAKPTPAPAPAPVVPEMEPLMSPVTTVLPPIILPVGF